jgi:hypothetical protein
MYNSRCNLASAPSPASLNPLNTHHVFRHVHHIHIPHRQRIQAPPTPRTMGPRCRSVIQGC